METRCKYAKDKVYPSYGGEFQLEQLRAMLPQYKPSFPLVDDESCDMEMTTAYPADISTMVPVSGKKEFHDGSSAYKYGESRNFIVCGKREFYQVPKYNYFTSKALPGS